MNDSTAPKTGESIGAIAGGIGCLALVGTVCVWWVCAVYAAGNSLWQVYLLKSRGQPAIAHVTGYTPEKRWGGGKHKPDIEVHFHTVEFDGHSGKVCLPQETPVGTEINVLYLPEAPEVVTAGTRDDSFLTLLHGKALGVLAWDGMMCSFSFGWLLFVMQLFRWYREPFSRRNSSN
jgi:hypothetical protein